MFTASAGSVVAGFMCLLSLLVQHPWALRPLLVDPFREMTLDAVVAAQRSFDQVRDIKNLLTAPCGIKLNRAYRC